MSRSGYVDDCWEDEDRWIQIMYRGAVASAFRGKRGQDFLREMLAALDAMPEKRLIADELEEVGAVCALGAVGKVRGLDMSTLNVEDYRTIAGKFGIAEAMVREISFMNDEAVWSDETPEQRWSRMRKWIAGEIRGD